MKLKLLVAVLLFCFSYAQNYNLPEVNITAKRISTIKTKSVSYEITTDSLGNFPLGLTEIYEVLNLVPSAYIRDYGGKGSLKTISLRGFATNFSKITILGVPYQNTFSSVVNLNVLPAAWLNSVEVLFFNTKTFAETSPVVINLKPNFKSKNYFTAKYGSFNSYELTANFNKKVKKVNLNLFGNLTHSDNTFKYNINEEQGTREKNPYNSGFLATATRYKNFKHEVNVISSFYYNDLLIPPPILKGNITGLTEKTIQKENFNLIQWRYTHNLLVKNIAGISFHYSELNYKNKLDIYNNYFSRNWYFFEKINISVGGGEVSLIYTLNNITASGNNLGKNFSLIPVIKRTENKFSLVYQLVKQKHLFSLRGDWREISDFNSKIQGGMNYSYLSDKWKVSFYALRSFRIPSLNELYFINFGNPNLKPEQADQIALYLARYYKKLYVFVSPFFNIVKNKIISVPVHPARWIAITLGHTQTKGIEAGYELILGKFYVFNSITYQKAQDFSLTNGNLLPYTPELIVKSTILYRNKSFSVGANADFVSHRFIDIGNDYFLDKYFLLRVNISKSIKIHNNLLQIQLNAENLLNTNYEIIRSYPMPSRGFYGFFKYVF